MLVKACTVMPPTADPVWLASVPLTVTVEFGPAIVGVIPVMEMASACCADRAGTTPLHPGGRRTAGREQRTESGEEDSDQRTQGANDGAHGLHVMAVRYKGLG